jgi:pilus assembly protein CpaC
MSPAPPFNYTRAFSLPGVLRSAGPVIRSRLTEILLLAGLALCFNVLRAATMPAVEQIQIGSGKTHLLDTEVNIQRVSVSAPEIAEAVPVSPRTLMLNGHLPGETSLVVWLEDGSRRQYDVNVTVPESRIETARSQLNAEFGDKVRLKVDNGVVFLSGTVKNLYSSQRAVSIAQTFGRVVNLLNVEVPPQETQVLLKVRFADVDRSKSLDLGINFAGAPKGFPFTASTGAYGGGGITALSPPAVSLSDSLNLLFFDPQINVGATLKDLAAKAVLQILAEPNVLALNGHEASFVSGGEFPYPTLQGGGSGVGQVTIQFRQFGVQIHFLPVVTPRGTIRLHVVPEVSSLDYADALSVSGYTIPALTTRRVETDVELKDGQSFAIAGLLDQRTTDSMSKIPGLAEIPLFGKLFTSRSTSKSNSELLVIVTLELVAPIPDAKSIPDLDRPVPLMQGDGILSTPPRTPGPDKTGPPSVKPSRDEIPVQEMEQFEHEQQAIKTATTPSSGTAFGSANQDSGSGGTPLGGAVPATTAPGASVPGQPSTQNQILQPGGKTSP